jgi:transposase
LPGLKRLLQGRGFGLVAAIGILAEIGDVTRFQSGKQLASYAGLVTSVRQSGTSERYGHITKEGRRLLRGFRVEAVLSMTRNPPRGGVPWRSSTSGRSRRRARAKLSAPRLVSS